MSSVELAVLLISADFLTSAFIRRTEIPRLLERRQTEGLRVIPLFIRPCAWETIRWLADLEGRPSSGRALSELRKHQAEGHLAALVTEIGKFLRQQAPAYPAAVPQSESLPRQRAVPCAETSGLPLASSEIIKDQPLPEPDLRDNAEFRRAKRQAKVALGCSLVGWLLLFILGKFLISSCISFAASMFFEFAGLCLGLHARGTLKGMKIQEGRGLAAWAIGLACFLPMLLVGLFATGIISIFLGK